MRVPDSHLPKGLESAASSSPKNEAVLPIIQKVRQRTRLMYVEERKKRIHIRAVVGEPRRC
jgi:hypothetical protein